MSGGWELLGSAAGGRAAALRAPAPRAPGLCRTCFGPAQPGRARCFPCGLHAECAPGLLASVVVPVAYAAKGGPHARRLWVYKSGQAEAGAAGQALTVLLLTFLHEHGPCVWRAAAWAGPDGATPAEWDPDWPGPDRAAPAERRPAHGRLTPPGPTHLAVVPSGRGRGGPHPLRGLVEPYLRLPWASLSACPDAAGDTRDLDAGRFTAAPLPGARVLLLDDTWTTGASVQSAAMALRQAGARAVAVVVLGRHLAPSRPAHAGLRTAAFAPRRCAVHVPLLEGRRGA